MTMIQNQPESGYQGLTEAQIDELIALEEAAKNGINANVKNGTAKTSDQDEFLEAARAFNGDELPGCLAHTFAHTHTTNTTPIRTHLQEAYEYQSRPEYGRAAPKPRRTRGPQKLTLTERLYKEAIEAMNTLEGAHEFSLGFSIGQEGSFMNASNPAQLFQKRLNRFLREAGLTDVAFAFAFDVNDEDKLHAHGSIVFRPEQEKAVKLALRKAGGIIKEQGAAARQLTLKASNPDRDPTGWLKYTTIYRAKVKNLFAYCGVKPDVYCGSSTKYRRMIR